MLEAEQALTSDPALALALAEQVEAAAESDALILQASTLVAIGLAHQGRLTEAVRRALMLLERAEGGARLRLLNVLGACYDLLERPEEAVRTYRRGLNACPPEDQESARKFLVNLGVALARLGSHREALRHFADARRLAREPGQQARLLMDSALSHIALEELDAAAAALEAARAAAERTGQPATVAYIEHNEARLALIRGQSGALQRFRDLLRVASLPVPLRAATLGELVRGADDDEEAVRCAQELLALPLDGHEFAIPAAEELVSRLERLGRTEEALGALKDLHRRTEERWTLRHRSSLDLLRIENEVDELRRRGRALAEANAQLRALNRDKDELMAIIGHDLRSPLLAVTLTADQLTDEVLDADELQVLGHALAGSAERMGRLIHQLLSAHALEDGPPQNTAVEYETARIARIALDSASANARRKRIALVYDGPVTLIAFGDPRSVEQALANLVDNAVKFSPWGGEVHLRLTPGPVFEVRDQGPGLTPQDRERAFGKFARLSARPTGDEPSTGLGLYIVQKLVTGMGGLVRIEDGAPGARFILDLSGP